jgi:sugar/nucleoside kinase (ribokinase family)
MNTPVFDFIGVGNALLDSIALVDDAFLPSVGGAKGGMELIDGETKVKILQSLPQAPVDAPGGSACNTTYALSCLGLKTTFLGKTGPDAEGTFYRETFASVGGDLSRFKSGNLPTGRCLSLVTPDAQRTMRTYLGSASDLSITDISVADFQGSRHAHIEGYMLFNQPLTQHVLECAKLAGCTISLDLSSFEVVHATRAILPDLLRQYVTVIIANEDETSAYFGSSLSYSDMALAFATICPLAVVKLGKSGSLVAQGSHLHTIAPALVEKPLESTGAGDAWAGGFLYGWLQGQPLPVCGSYGSILGAEVVKIMGATLPASHWPSVKEKLQAVA